MRLDAVILNYNDADTVVKQLSVIRNYDILSKIIIVDNCSTDDSLEKLRVVCGEDSKLVLLSADKNGGYGYGNNLGVRYAAGEDQATHVLIANPDVMMSEACLRQLLHMFENHPDAAIVTAKMQDAQYGDMKNGWPLRGFVRELLSMGPVSRRMFRGLMEYPESYVCGGNERVRRGRRGKLSGERKAVYVDAVHGSMLMVDTDKFLDAGGYDEGIFLYEEEAVLGWRMKTAGYRSILVLNESYRHEHSASISKSFAGQLQRQKLREESTLYYMKHYLFINPAQEMIAKLWFAGIRAEILVAGAVARLQNPKDENDQEAEENER